MKELKARAFCKKSKEWRYIVIGQPFGGLALSVYNDICLSGAEWNLFTGLKDKNGKEVYEGMRLKSEDEEYVYFEVAWDKKNACFDLWGCGYAITTGEGSQEVIDNEISVIDSEFMDFMDVVEMEIMEEPKHE